METLTSQVFGLQPNDFGTHYALVLNLILIRTIYGDKNIAVELYNKCGAEFYYKTFTTLKEARAAFCKIRREIYLGEFDFDNADRG